MYTEIMELESKRGSIVSVILGKEYISGILLGYDVSYIFVKDKDTDNTYMINKKFINFIEFEKNGKNIEEEKVDEVNLYKKYLNKDITVKFPEGDLTMKLIAYDKNTLLMEKYNKRFILYKNFLYIKF